MSDRNNNSLAWYVLVPAVVMSLGWGLRGYIGGGPLGAMIPGALVALVLCLLLEYGVTAAAVAAAFGAVGVGFGGDMTYGQTIGLARESESMLWGLTGLTLKGAVWGLLGGAVLGVALAWRHVDRRRFYIALAWFLAAVALGIMLINEPKIIYFSNRYDKPRDESWAGLLFGAVALLAYLKARQKEAAPIALRFAGWGALGGGLGFGLGGLYMAIGSNIEGMNWMPWWKFMEFTFGLLFGAALGYSAYLQRHVLKPVPEPQATRPARVSACLGAAALVVAALLLWPMIGAYVAGMLRGAPLPWLLQPIGRTLLGYTALGCILLVLASRSESAAWQIAASITFIASVIDLQEDFGPEGGLQLNALFRILLVLVAAVAMIVAVIRWQRRSNRDLVPLTLGLMWALMAVALVKPFIRKDFVAFVQGAASADPSGAGTRLLDHLEGQGIVHGIFIALAVASTWAILAWRRDNPPPIETRPQNT